MFWRRELVLKCKFYPQKNDLVEIYFRGGYTFHFYPASTFLLSRAWRGFYDGWRTCQYPRLRRVSSERQSEQIFPFKAGHCGISIVYCASWCSHILAFCSPRHLKLISDVSLTFKKLIKMRIVALLIEFYFLVWLITEVSCVYSRRNYFC